MARPKKKTTEQLSEEIQTEAAAKPSKRPVETFPSGSTVFDLILGGGLPVGKIVNIVGDNSTGKTLLACEIIASARKHFGDKLRYRYNDAEAGFSFDSQALYGFDIIDDDKEPSTTIEELEADLDRELEALQHGETLVYVLDSLDALSSLSEIEAAADRRKALDSGKVIKGSYGMQKQKFLSELFRLQATKIKDKRCCLIVISQVRENIGVMYGPKYRRSGGKALDFYAAQIVWLAEAERHEKRGRATGITVKAKITKNKIGLPFRTGYIDILFNFGVDDISTNLNYLCDNRTDTGKLKKNAKYAFGGKKEMDIDAAIKYVEDMSKEAELADAVKELWAKRDAVVDTAARKKRF